MTHVVVLEVGVIVGHPVVQYGEHHAPSGEAVFPGGGDVQIKPHRPTRLASVDLIGTQQHKQSETNRVYM